MGDKQTSAGKGRSAGFVFRALGRAVVFALAGAFVLSIVGAIEGAVTGPLFGILQMYSSSSPAFPLNNFYVGYAGRPSYSFSRMQPRDAAFLGLMFVAYLDAVIGAVLGAIAFCIIGVMASFARAPNAVLRFALRRAVRGSVIGIALGGVIGAVNGFLLAFVLPRSYFSGAGPSVTAPIVAGLGFFIGVVLGFVIGVLYSSIKGALIEMRS